MSDNTHKKQKEVARKQKQLESRMAEIKEIEQLQTISEDETDREMATKTPQFDAGADGKGSAIAATPDLVPQSVLAAEKRTSSAVINPQSDEHAYALSPHPQDTEESFGRAPAADLDTRHQAHLIENKPGTSNHGANIHFQNGSDENSGGRRRGSAKKQAVQSAHPSRQGQGKVSMLPRGISAEPGDLSSKGALLNLDINPSRLSSETRQSAGQGTIGKPVKFVNLQALIDREILIDQML